MGDGSEPDGDRGFGRVHLETGVPLNGESDIGLFVADSNWTAITSDSTVSYYFAIYEHDVGEFRATLTWMDPPSATISSVQLQHDLDLKVTSPDGTVYTMWLSGEADSANVIERVIVPSADVEASNGTWIVTVTSGILTENGSQAYSLVVTGPFGSGNDINKSSTIRIGSSMWNIALHSLTSAVFSASMAALFLCL